jgi:hypothetical protein
MQLAWLRKHAGNARVRPDAAAAPQTPAGLLVEDAADAFAQATANGGVGVLPPTRLDDTKGGAGGGAVVSEVKLYGDVVLRFVSGDYAVGTRGGRRGTCTAGSGGFSLCGGAAPRRAAARPSPPRPPAPAPPGRRVPSSPATCPRPTRRASATACGGSTTPSATPTTS